MICLEIIDIFAKNKGPEFFAQKLDNIQGFNETRPRDGEPK